MNSSEYQSQTGYDVNFSNNVASSDNLLDQLPPQKKSTFLREKILEEDRKKRRNIIFAFGFVISTALIIAIFVLSFKPSILQDSYLINNIELLSSTEDLDFYSEMEFYQWLDLAATEQSVDSM